MSIADSRVESVPDTVFVPVVTADGLVFDLPPRCGVVLADYCAAKCSAQSFRSTLVRLSPLPVGCSSRRASEFILRFTDACRAGRSDMRQLLTHYVSSSDLCELCPVLLDILNLSYALGARDVQIAASRLFGEIVRIDFGLSDAVYSAEPSERDEKISLALTRTQLSFLPFSRVENESEGAAMEDSKRTLEVKRVTWNEVRNVFCPCCSQPIISESHCRVCGESFSRACASFSVPREFARVKKPRANERGEFVKSCRVCYENVLKVSRNTYLASAFMLSGLSCVELNAMRRIACWSSPLSRALDHLYRIRSLSSVASHIPCGRLQSMLLSSATSFRGHPQAVVVLHKAMASADVNYYLGYPLAAPGRNQCMPLSEFCVQNGGVAFGDTQASIRLEASRIIIETLGQWCDELSGDAVVGCAGEFSHESLGCPPSCSNLLPQFVGLDLLASIAIVNDVPDYLSPYVSFEGLSLAEQEGLARSASTTGAILKRLAVQMLLGGVSSQRDCSFPEHTTVDIERMVRTERRAASIANSVALYKAVVPVLVDGLASASVRWAAGSLLSAFASVNRALALCIAIEIHSRGEVSFDHSRAAAEVLLSCASDGDDGMLTRRTLLFLTVMDKLGVGSMNSIVYGLVDRMSEANLTSVRAEVFYESDVFASTSDTLADSSRSKFTLNEHPAHAQKRRFLDAAAVLELPDLPVHPFLHPFDASKVIVAVRLRGISLKENAATRPMVVPLVDKHGDLHSVLYKREPMRQDMVASRVNSLLLFLLSGGSVAGESDANRLSIPQYDVLCITPQSGLIELVPNASTLQRIRTQFGKSPTSARRPHGLPSAFENKTHDCSPAENASRLASSEYACNSLHTNSRKVPDEVATGQVHVSAPHGALSIKGTPILPTVLDARESAATCAQRGPLLSFYLEQVCGEQPSSGLERISEEEAARRFLFSAQYFLVVNYWLAISDRHRDNVMVTNDGYVFHIDFGWMLGSSPNHEAFVASVARNAPTSQCVRFDADFKECVVYFMRVLSPHGEGGMSENPAPKDGSPPAMTDDAAIDGFIRETANLFIKLRPYSYAVLTLLQHLIHSPPPGAVGASGGERGISLLASTALAGTSSAAATAGRWVLGGAMSMASYVAAVAADKWTGSRGRAGGVAAAAGGTLEQPPPVGASLSMDLESYLEERTALFFDHSMGGLNDEDARSLFEKRMRECLVSRAGTLRDWAHDAAAIYRRVGRLF